MSEALYFEEKMIGFGTSYDDSDDDDDWDDDDDDDDYN